LKKLEYLDKIRQLQTEFNKLEESLTRERLELE